MVLERDAGLPAKACGEGLMPGGVRVLDALGVHLGETRELRGIRFLDGPLMAAAAFPELPGRGICRRVLMEGLAARAKELGVVLLHGHTLREFHYRQRLLWATAAGPGGPVTFRAQLLVGADGLRSGVRRRLGYEQPPRRAPRFGLHRHYACAPWTDWVEVHWADGAEAYVTPLGASRVGVALLMEGAPRPFEQTLARFPALSRSLAACSEAGRVRGAGPFEQRASGVLAPGVALVGDAAGYLDALSGEGLSLGFRSATALVDRFADGELWRYPGDHARTTLAYHALTLSMLEIARRPWLRRAALRWLDRHPALFSDLLGVAAESRAPARSAIGGALRWALAAAA